MFSREVEAVKFEMKQGELNRRIEAYKTALAAGEFARASWPHLAAWLDTTEEALGNPGGPCPLFPVSGGGGRE